MFKLYINEFKLRIRILRLLCAVNKLYKEMDKILENKEYHHLGYHQALSQMGRSILKYCDVLEKECEIKHQ